MICYNSYLSKFQFDIPCDENETHTAVVYCLTCETHLCLECSDTIHNTRTLIKHKRVPISEKPRENPKCIYHPMHFVEFACLEEECKSNPLMCYICKDYGRHVKHKVCNILNQSLKCFQMFIYLYVLSG